MSSTLNLNENKLKNSPKTWLITGVAGFIGSNLLEYLLKLDQKVIGIDNFYTGYKKNLKEVENNVKKKQWNKFKFINGDICNLKTCNIVCKKADYVLHNAALGSVPRSIKDPINTNNVNINGFLNILLASNQSKVKRFIYASSSSVYGDNLKLPKLENKIGCPISPYALTKLTNEHYAYIFSRIYKINCIGLRYFNVFGQRQDPKSNYSAVIPVWIKAMINKKTVYINGDGKTSRDFCHIKNVIQANVLAATSNNSFALNNVYNVAFGEKNTLNKLFSEIRNILLPRYPYLSNINPKYRDFRPGDVRHSLADISKSRKLLGYKPIYNLREGLIKTIDWYINQ